MLFVSWRIFLSQEYISLYGEVSVIRRRGIFPEQIKNTSMDQYFGLKMGIFVPHYVMRSEVKKKKKHPECKISKFGGFFYTPDAFLITEEL